MKYSKVQKIFLCTAADSGMQVDRRKEMSGSDKAPKYFKQIKSLALHMFLQVPEFARTASFKFFKKPVKSSNAGKTGQHCYFCN